LGDTWRSWDLVLPALERRHDMLALTLAGHAGGPAIEGEITQAVLADAVESALDDEGLQTAHIVGNSLGGFVALQLASRGRHRATEYITINFEHIPAELLAYQLRGAAGCVSGFALIDYARRAEWHLDAERITCPVRILWGTDDRLLPWPSAALRFREEWLPHADWIELEGVGHCPQLDVPVEVAEFVLRFTAR
jgi:pimeloyl-ACP methyl ester carboxylesterase